MSLTVRNIARLAPKTAVYLVRDNKEPALVVQVFPTGRKAFQVRTRIGEAVKTCTLGNVESLTLKEARQHAKNQVEKWHRLKEAKQTSPTLATFIRGEWNTHVFTRWKPSTQRTATHYLTKRILPALGAYALTNLTYEVIDTWFETFSQTAKGGANRALDVLKTVFPLAQRLGYCHHDPCRLIERNPKKRFNRFLSEQELNAVGEVLKSLENQSQTAHQQANVIRLLLLTGCRVSEILTLKWSMVTAHTIELPDSKTGARSVYLSTDAAQLLSRQPVLGAWVFPSPQTGLPYHSISPFWYKVRALANMCDVRIHDLRHTFASHAALQGNSVPMIAKMLGHSHLSMTLRYAHVHDNDVAQASERIGGIYEAILNTGKVPKGTALSSGQAKRVQQGTKPLTLNFTEQERERLLCCCLGGCVELWLLEQLKLGIFIDKQLEPRERFYRVRAKYERYKQKHRHACITLVLTVEEYDYFREGAKRCQLSLKAWARVKALDACHGV